MTKHTLSFTNSPFEPPVIAYIKHLQAHTSSLHFEMRTEEDASSPTFIITDGEQGFLSELCRAQERDFLKYTFTVTKGDGEIVMSSADWTTPSDEESPLQHLYLTLADMVMQQEDKTVKTDSALEDDPGAETPESLMIDDFINALIADAKSGNPTIPWERSAPDSENEYIARGFGISECSIRLTKNRLNETGSTFTLRYESSGGAEIFSSVVSCVATETSDLGMLYELIDTQEIQTDIAIAMKEAERFACNAKFAAAFDRIVGDNFPVICQPNPETGEGVLLVHDIFTEASQPATVRCFIDEIKKRHPELTPSYILQLQTLADCIFKLIRHTPRNPNGAVFINRDIPISFHNKEHQKRKQTTTASSLSQIANSQISWLDFYGSRNDGSVRRLMTKYAVLLLAVIMVDYIDLGK